MIRIITKNEGITKIYENENFNKLEYIDSFSKNEYLDSSKTEFELLDIHYQTIELIMYYIKSKKIIKHKLHSNIIKDLLFLGYPELFEEINNLSPNILIKYNVTTFDELLNQLFECKLNKLCFQYPESFNSFLETENFDLISDEGYVGFIHSLYNIKNKEIQKYVLENCDITLLSKSHERVINFYIYYNVKKEDMNKYKYNDLYKEKRLKNKSHNNETIILITIIFGSKYTNYLLDKLLEYNIRDKIKDVFIQSLNKILKKTYILNEKIKNMNTNAINLVVDQLKKIKDYRLKAFDTLINFNKNIFIFRELLELNKNYINKISNDVVRNNNNEMIKELLKLKPDITQRDEDNNTMLILACRNNNINIVKELLKLKPDINVKNNDSNTPLMYAVYNNNFNMVKLLLSLKSKVLVNNKYSALLIGFRYKSINIIRLLLNYYKPKDNKNIEQLFKITLKQNNYELYEILKEYNLHLNLNQSIVNNILVLSCKNDNLKMVSDILNFNPKPEINYCTKTIDYPLINAIKHCNIKLIELLLKHNPDINVKDNRGNTCLIIAVQNNNRKMIKIILNYGADINIRNNNNKNALLIAVKKSRIKTVEILLNYNLDINILDNENNSALMIAISKNEIEMVRLLLKHHPNLNIINVYNNSALMLASNNIEITKLLLEHNPDINIENIEGYNALMYSIKYNHIKTTQLLLNNGADIKMKQYNKALLNAVKTDNIKMLKLLLEHIIKIDLIYDQIETIILLAIKNNNKKIINLLLDFNIDTINKNDILLKLITNNDLENIQKLLKHEDIDINYNDKFNNTALMFACDVNNIEIVKELLKYNSNIDFNTQNILKSNALLLAVSNNSIPIVKLLLEYDIDVNLTNDMYITPLMMACKEDNYEIVKLLLDKGANKYLRCEYGDTALDYTKKESNIIKELIK